MRPAALPTLRLLTCLQLGAILSTACTDSREESPPAEVLPSETPAPSPSDPGPTPAPPSGSWWRPQRDTSWQIQLTGPLDMSVEVDVYDVDLFDTPASAIAKLHDQGRKVICYFSAGSYEDWRPDVASFPQAALGAQLDDWPGERWLDIRDSAVRAILRARLDLAVQKGCDGVDPDNVDGYANSTGFRLTATDQLDFNRFLAAESHARGLAVGLKNDVGQIAELVDDFDWQLNEECFLYDECNELEPFLLAGKPVFQIEYGDSRLAAQVCPRAKALGLETLVKNLDLDAPRLPCR